MAIDDIAELVERYLRQRDVYESDRYNETTLRREFVDPFFRLLGWDMDNREGLPEPYKDVIHEDEVQVSGQIRAPDYSFRVGGIRKFMVEAKRPSVNIKQGTGPAYQLRRYGWSAALPLGILTEFSEFAVYDTRIQPVKGDSAAVARLLFMTCDEYVARWDEIWGIFSREAVHDGRFDDYAARTILKRGTIPVDAAFLSDIEAWRDVLAHEIAASNAAISERELNLTVQSTIDRMVFLRIAEDRGLEPYGSVRDAAARTDIYGRMTELFRRADARYNSGLFHFGSERGRAGDPDTLSLTIHVGDDALRSIISRLYFPESPYEFSVVPAEILGQVYEQFLGKVIVRDPGGQLRVEFKPEVKRAGGVFYTPSFVVRFIVQNTLGAMLASTTPEAMGRRSQPLAVVDPACGSGSFLIEAYQQLLDWHLAYYSTNDADRWMRTRPPRIYRDVGGQLRLTSAERKRVLTSHIYGVDIDAQAVEVTKLSLLLKVLEGESSESIQQELRLFAERALPDLDSNIKCGNSLVKPDLFDNEQMGLFSGHELERINVFDWSAEFPAVMASGGFDCAIGNPPYVYRNATEVQLRRYYMRSYRSAEGNFELYKFFVERALSLLRPRGRLGYIISASFLVQPSFRRLRQLLLDNYSVRHLAPLGPHVFRDAVVDTAILVAENTRPEPDTEVEVREPARPTLLGDVRPKLVSQSRWRTNPGSVIDYRLGDEDAAVLRRLAKAFPPLEEGFEFGVGINTGFIRNELVADRRVDERYHPMVTGSGIERNGPVSTTGWILYDPAFVQSRGSLGRSLPPERFFTEPKVLVVRTRNLSLPIRIVATLDTTGAYNLNRLSNILARPGRSLLGLLGALNSTLYNWLFSTRFFDYEVKPVYLRACPMPNTQDPSLVAAVERVLELNAQLHAAHLPDEKAALRRLASAAESEIDSHVFRLFGVTPEEEARIRAHPVSVAAAAAHLQ